MAISLGLSQRETGILDSIPEPVVIVDNQRAVVAVNQIGVATALVNTLFMAVVGGLALALGLSFGLGGRDTAAEIIRHWRERARSERSKLEKATDIAGERSKQETEGLQRMQKNES